MQMPYTQAEKVDAQYALEAEAMNIGIARYREALADGGNAEVPAGQQLIKAAIRPMEDALKVWLKDTSEGMASRHAGTFYFVNILDPVAVAWLTAQAAISLLHKRCNLTKMAVALAMNMEAAINIEEITKTNPRLAKAVAQRAAVKKRAKDRLDFIRKGLVMAKTEAETKKLAEVDKKLEKLDAPEYLVGIRKGAELVDVKSIAWDEKSRIRVGALLLTMFSQSTGLIEIETLPCGAGKTSTLVRPSESCLKWLENSHARCELLSPARLPMICRPKEWTGPFNGGYLTKSLRQPVVKTRARGYLAELREWEMPQVYAAINSLQATQWAVNVPILATVKEMWEASSTAAGLPSRLDAPLPAKSWQEGEQPDAEVLHTWKVEAARTHEANDKGMGKRLQLVQKLWTAEVMLERGNSFHYVYNMDWRGRLYPVGSGMNPQGDDVAKALLRFAAAVPLGDEGAYWLAVHGANTFGVDKVSFEERIKWVEDHTDAILAAANSPTFATDLWQQADSPFQFLAFCKEWAGLQTWVDAGGEPATFCSSLPVAFDGTCNGLQNFAAMLRDPVGGAATGLVPGEKPADVYTEVAKASQARIDAQAEAGNATAQRWVGKMTRALAKQNTMTVPYGVTQRGMGDQLFALLQKNGSPAETLREDASYLAACNLASIGEVVVAAQRAMDWLKEAAKVAASNKLPVRWETPMGFLAVQDYRIDTGDQADFTVLGRRYRLILSREGDKLNTRKQALGMSPNFVHSLDASHLMRTVLFCVEDGMKDFAMIHDSYGCHAGRAALLRDNLRDAFVDQYSQPVLEKFRAELLDQLPVDMRDQLPALPEMGTLDLELVRQSDYFFA